METTALLNIWQTFMGVTVLTGLALSAAAGLLGLATPSITVNSLGLAVSVGDAVEAVAALGVGLVATLILNTKSR